MKKILILIGFLYSLNSFSQSTVLLRGDTIKVYKQGGDAVLKVEGHLMLKDYRQGNSNDSVLTWDPVTLKVRMMDRSSFAGAGGTSGWDAVLAVDGHSPTITDEVNINMSTNGFNILNAGNVSLLSTSNDWFLGKNGGVYIEGTGSSNKLHLSAERSATRLSDITLDADSISIRPGGNGKINIDSLRSITDTTANKPMTWNPTTGQWSYNTSWPSGGGSGTPGGSNKQVQYNNSSAFGGYTGFEVGNTNNDVLITAGATTSVPLNIKLQSSQTANALNISSSAGTGDLASITKDGYLTAARLTASNISATNVVYAGTAGLLQGTSDFAYAPTDPNMLTVTGSNSARSSILVQNLNSNGNASSYWQNDRGSLSTYAGFLVGGSTDGGGNLFGLSRVDRAFLIADGTTSTGLSVGTLTADDLVLGTNNTTRVTVASGGGVTVSDLAGTLNRPVYASSTGLLSAAAHTMSKGFFLEIPTSSEAVDMWQTQVAITITSLKAILRGSSPSVTYNIKFGTDITSATSVFTSDITCTSVTTGCSNSSGFNDATIPAGSFIWIVTTAASGTIASIGFTLNYTED